MTTDKLEKAIKSWISLKCSHCGKLNPLDVTKCIYCNHLIRRHIKGGQNGQGSNR